MLQLALNNQSIANLQRQHLQLTRAPTGVLGQREMPRRESASTTGHSRLIVRRCPHCPWYDQCQCLPCGQSQCARHGGHGVPEQRGRVCRVHLSPITVRHAQRRGSSARMQEACFVAHIPAPVRHLHFITHAHGAPDEATHRAASNRRGLLRAALCNWPCTPPIPHCLLRSDQPPHRAWVLQRSMLQCDPCCRCGHPRRGERETGLPPVPLLNCVCCAGSARCW